MKLACVHLGNRLIPVVQGFDCLVLIKDLFVFEVHIILFAKLKTVVLANSENLAVLGEIEGVLKAQGNLSHNLLGQSLDQKRVFAVYVVPGAQLAAVIVTPGENTVVSVNHVDKPAAHGHLINFVVKSSLDSRLIYGTFEKRCPPLYRPYYPRKFLIMLNKSVS